MMETEPEKVKSALKSGEFEEILEESSVKPTDRVGREGFSMIHWACFYGRIKALHSFLAMGRASELISIIDIHGWTPSHVCAIKNQEECIKLLIENGADVTARDNRGYTCGHCAATHGNTAVLQHILNAGHDINLIDARSWSVVHHAAFYGNPKTLQVLAQLGADLSTVDLKGNLPAHLAACEGRLECLRLLVDFNHTPLQVLNARNNYGETPKDLAIQFMKTDCAEFLSLRNKELQGITSLEDGHEVDNPAHDASDTGDLPLLTTLIQNGECSINERDKFGSTLVHRAASNGRVSCLKWLIDNGADLSLTNNLKESPLDVARKYGKTQCIALIEEGIGLEKSCAFESLDQAKNRIDELEKMLNMSKETFLKLGGTLEEEDKHKKKVNEIMEIHRLEIKELESKLELEREKRELLEREADMLRLELHQANNTLLHYKALLAAETANTSVPERNNAGGKKKVILTSSTSSKQKRKEANDAHSRRMGGAYIDLNSSF